jgi:hypothetical protein
MPKLLEQFGITDWVIELSPPVEKTEDEDLAIEKTRIEIATQMQQLGYEAVKDKGKEIRFNYKKQAMPAGGPGGMPGMEMGGAPPMPGMEGGEAAAPPLAPPPPPPGVSEGGLLDDDAAEKWLDEENEETK